MKSHRAKSVWLGWSDPIPRSLIQSPLCMMVKGKDAEAKAFLSRVADELKAKKARAAGHDRRDFGIEVHASSQSK